MSGFNEVKTWHRGIILKDLSDRLKQREYTVEILNTREEITDFILGAVPVEASVGIGGSVTIRELGIDALLRQRGSRIYDHWDKDLSKEDVLKARKKQLSSDFFLTSLNAVTMTGQIVNIDGIGNRVASMIFGPGHVIAVIGINKIVKDVDEALWRIKNIATPMNCKRLGVKTPCASKGYCVECRPENSVCKITTIIEARPALTGFTIILSPLELGF